MDAWSKTLLSTSAGFIAGLASEPIKLWIGANSARRSLKKALYDELGKSCGKMASVVQYAAPQDDDPSLLWGLRTFGLSPITVDVFDPLLRQTSRPRLLSPRSSMVGSYL